MSIKKRIDEKKLKMREKMDEKLGTKSTSKRLKKAKIKAKGNGVKSKSSKSGHTFIDNCIALFLFVAVCLFVFTGCLGVSPPARSNTNKTKITINVYGAHNYIAPAIGDGVLASADSEGSTESFSAQPTQTVTPTTDLNLNKNAANGAANALGSLGGVLSALFGNGGVKNGNNANADCPDGNCGESKDCPDGNCGEIR